jgi:hypothetical protein
MILQNLALKKGKEVAGHNVSQKASGGENVPNQVDTMLGQGQKTNWDRV